MSNRFVARTKNSGRFFESAPDTSYKFINNGYPDTLSTKPRILAKMLPLSIQDMKKDIG